MTDFFLGADIGGTNLRVALGDASGRVLAVRRASIAGERDPLVVVARMRELADALVAGAGALRAIGVGAPGVTDVERGVVLFTSYLMGWRDVPLRAYLEDAFQVPAAIDNDVNLAALGESRAGVAQGVDNFVFAAIGTGIGAGIILNGRLHRGSTWRAGEIGFLLVPGVSEDPVAEGDPGAFEAEAGGEAIRQKWPGRDLTATEIFDRARAGDKLAGEVLRDAARVLSYGIYNLAMILDCPLVVLGGSVGLHPALGEEIRRLLSRRASDGMPRIVTSALGDQAQLTGAVHLALDFSKTSLE